MGGGAGAGLAWLLGRAAYFLFEDLPYRNEPPEVRLVHAVDGGLGIGLLTFFILTPLGFMIGLSITWEFMEKRNSIST